MQSTEQEVANLPSIVLFLSSSAGTRPRPFIIYLHAAGAMTAQVVVTETIWPTEL